MVAPNLAFEPGTEGKGVTVAMVGISLGEYPGSDVNMLASGMPSGGNEVYIGLIASHTRGHLARDSEAP
jgi:hypothetical protein